MSHKELHPAHFKPGIKPLDDTLHVVTMISNPLRWRSRYWNYWGFQHQVENSGAKLYTAEVAYGSRDFEITEAGNPHHLQLRSDYEIWHKENAINLMIQRLPADAKYVAWIDADVKFGRWNWVQETLQLLQHYDVIQMFSHAQDMGPEFELVGPPEESFMSKYINSIAIGNIDGGEKPLPLVPKSEPTMVKHGSQCYGAAHYGHPGYAWAARRKSLDKLGGLIDVAIMGSADWHMAMALVGKAELTLKRGYAESYNNHIRLWQERAEKHIERNVGFMSGTLLHGFHGPKRKRYYATRTQILNEVGFDPALDLVKDTQGLWALTGRNFQLRDGLRQYSRMRNEDATELY